jgi:hypothetical protein
MNSLQEMSCIPFDWQNRKKTTSIANIAPQQVQGLDETLSLSRDQLQIKHVTKRRMNVRKTVAVDLHSYNRIIELE